MKPYHTQRYELTLKFQAPFLSQASGTLALGQDVAMQRYNQIPAINGSLLRGNIRGTLESFIATIGKDQPQGKKLGKFVREWFGKPPKEQDGELTLTSERSRIAFDLFWLFDGNAIQNSQRTRIQLDETGKVKKGALQVIENCFPVASELVEFKGQLTVKFSQNESQRKAEMIDFVRNIKLALASIPAMGSLKGIGFGKLDGYELTEVKSPQVLLQDTLLGNEKRFSFRFTLDKPFCLGKPRTPESNRIVSDDVISGNVIKGVIASQFKGQKDWQEALCFDALIFSHAMPAASGSSDTTLPLPMSLAFLDTKTESDVLVDFTTLKAVDDSWWDGVKRAPIFQPDWKKKHFTMANNIFKVTLVRPERLLLVRTGMNHQQGISAESQLFSVECVEPEGFTWSGEVDLSAVPDDKRASVLSKLREIFTEGLDGIGKTQASIKDVELHPLPDDLDDSAFTDLGVGDQVVITLLTDARLMRQGFERETQTQTARGLYEDYWTGVSDGALRLVDFFAQQYISGGDWHHHYFQAKKTYMPEWLTRQGSVFVLALKGESAIDQLREWQRTGLLIANNAGGVKPTWKDTPYLPEHGYGRIKINWKAQLDCALSGEV